MKCLPSDSVLAPYFKVFIQERVERLVLEGEKLPGFLRGKEELVPMRKQATEVMGEDEAGCLINAARSLDISPNNHALNRKSRAEKRVKLTVKRDVHRQQVRKETAEHPFGNGEVVRRRILFLLPRQ